MMSNKKMKRKECATPNKHKSQSALEETNNNTNSTSTTSNMKNLRMPGQERRPSNKTDELASLLKSITTPTPSISEETASLLNTEITTDNNSSKSIIKNDLANGTKKIKSKSNEKKKVNINEDMNTTKTTTSGSSILSYLKSFNKANSTSTANKFNNNVRKLEAGIRKACGVTLFTWLALFFVTMGMVRREHFVVLNTLERNCNWVAFMLIGLSFISRLMPLMYRKDPTSKNKKNKAKFVSCHGVVLGAVVVQSIAMVTDLCMAILPTPVLVDPVTGVRVAMLRWVEWTPLAFLMTFMTEIVGMEDCSCSHCNPKKKNDKNSIAIATTNQQKCNLTEAWVIAILQGLSTICGLFFPFCTNVWVWTFVMIISFLTFLTIFPRLYIRWKALQESTYKRQLQQQQQHSKKMNDSKEILDYDNDDHNRRRLSFQLMLSCVITWSTLVLFYFVAWLGPLYSHPDSVLRADETPMIMECFLDVLAKCFYLLVIVEIHMVIFDDDVRAARRLKEMRQMMSAVWESSSDVIAISVRSPGNRLPSSHDKNYVFDTKSVGKVTTMLSPTYKRLFELDKNEAEAINYKNNSPINQQKDDDDTSYYDYHDEDFTNESKVVVFDLDDTDFNDFHHYKKSVSPKYSFADPFNQDNDSIDGSIVDNTEEERKKNAMDKSELISIGDLIVKAWNLEKRREHLIHHDVPRSDGVILNFEANITWITEDQNCLIIVMRDITERVMRFEAEKRIVSESTARAKDAEANRFTRHEVKNGLLAAIELCKTLRSAYDVQLENSIVPHGGDAKVLLQCVDDGGDDDIMQQNVDMQEYFKDLKHTLNEVLDTILSEAMARDVINEVYQPKLDRVDIRKVMCGTGTKSHVEYERFPFVSFPSPLPHFLFDGQLLKHIHQNAISNACKYGKVKGVVLTQVQYDATNRILDMSVINLPGPNHDKLLAVDSEQANQTVFAQGTRFSVHDKYNTNQSSGDGAWIMSKCAKTLGGECSIKFEPKRTVFRFRCPAIPYHESLQQISVDDIQNFRVPSETWGIVIDDSKIQRKMLDRFLSIVGVYADHRMVLGKNEDEILSFVNIAVKMIQKHNTAYFLLIVDENLNVTDDINSDCISGSQLVEEIRSKLIDTDEERVLALVRSANDSMDDVSIYRRRAHDYLPKSSMQRNSVLELFVPIWGNRFPHLKHDLCGNKRITSFHEFPAMIRSSSISSVNTAATNMTLTKSAVNNSVDAQPREAILQTVDVIDALVHEESLLLQRWAMVWNKLHLLKGDMMSIGTFGGDSSAQQQQYINRLRFATHGIEKLRGNTMPHDFIQRWREIRAFILSAFDNTVSVCNSSSSSGSSFKD